MPPSAAGAPPSPRSPAATWLACALFALGAPGLLLCLTGLSRALGTRAGGPVGRNILIVDSVLQVLGKCALLALAAALLTRSRKAPAAAWSALAMAAAGSIHTLWVVVPRQATALEGAAVAGHSLGAYATCLVSLLLYAALILYLRTETARKEFGL